MEKINKKVLFSPYSLKLNLAMKLTVFLFIVSIFSVEANGYGQNIKVTLEMEHVQIRKVLENIESQTDYKFFYNNKAINTEKFVSIQAKNKILSEVLDELFKATSINYVIKKKQIILKVDIKQIQSLNIKVDKGLRIQMDTQEFATGVVTDEQNVPLSGANIVEKGTTNGVTADFDGNFSIAVTDENAILVVSYIGFIAKEIQVDGQTTLNIKLQADQQQLDEVVVVGYGTSRKSDLTGSLSSVSSADFEDQPLTTVDQAIQGRSSGVQVTQSSGAPGEGFKIRIRGTNSINGDNSPLYVLDGMIVENISSLNVNDIKAMEVLKDASATAIYGSRGANGVVLITTKKGKSGPGKISLSYFTGFKQVSQQLDVMSPAEFAESVNFVENSEFYSEADIEKLRNGGGENWSERLFKTAYSNNLQLSASGGSDNMDYFVSGNYYRTEGVLIDQTYERYNLRANLNAKISDRTQIGLNTSVNRENFEGARANLAFGLTWDPTTPAFNEAGEYNFTPLVPGVGNAEINPLILPENGVREAFHDNLMVNGYINSEIARNLVLNISGGLNRVGKNNNSYDPLVVNGQGTANIQNNEVTRLQNTNRLTYNNEINDNHVLKIDVVHEQQLVTSKFTGLNGQGFFSDQTNYKNIALARVQRTSNTNFDESIQSFLGRVNYSLMDKYLLSASVRTDGSSKFRNDNVWGVFPSASIAWRLSQENFIQKIKAVNNLKLRASYGVTGSQAISPLSTLSIPQVNIVNNYPFDGGQFTTGVAPSNQLANENLTWETTKQSNYGFDLGLWNSSVTLSFDSYYKRTSDLLLNTVLPAFVGPTVQVRNVGEVENKGFDISLGLNLIKNENWNVQSTFNFSRNKNKVLSLVDGLESIELGRNDYYALTSNDLVPTKVAVGHPISSFRGYIYEGVYQLGEEDAAALVGAEPGDAKYRDVSGPDGIPDGLITDDDIAIVGSGNADFTWGWNWNVGWKNFDLNFILLGSQGNDIYNFTRARMMGIGPRQFHAVHSDYLNRWTPNNPSNIPSGRDGTELLSTQFLEDGSYITMKNITLGYNITKEMIPKSFIDDMRIYLSAENLFILTDYTGFDPESTASGGSDLDLGIDLDAYPINKSFTLGLNINF